MKITRRRMRKIFRKMRKHGLVILLVNTETRSKIFKILKKHKSDIIHGKDSPGQRIIYNGGINYIVEKDIADGEINFGSLMLDNDAYTSTRANERT